MPHDPPVTAILIVVAPANDRVYHATLPNGKPVFAHVPRSSPPAWLNLPPGSRVLAELTPYDFQHARVAGLVPDPPPAPEDLSL